jgi:hypothetical protein
VVKRITAGFLAGGYFLTNAALAHSAESNFWAQRRRARTATTQMASMPLGAGPNPLLNHLPTITRQAVTPHLSATITQGLPQGWMEGHKALFESLPGNLGTIRKITLPLHAAPDGPVVLHIQDVHQNQEAQRNIAKTIKSLVDSGQAGAIALEGAFEPIDLKRFRAFEDRDVVRKVADYLLRENKITGPIHTAMTGPVEFPPVVGVDDRVHYDANVEAYKQSAPLLEEYRKKIQAVQTDLENQKQRLYNPALLAFDRVVESYRQGKTGLGGYVKAILPPPLRGRVGVGGETSVESFRQALALEETLDFKRVEQERRRIIELLTPRLTKAQTDDLLQTSVAYRMGQISYAGFYGRLKDLCQRHGVPLSQYPAMEGYIRYVLLADKVDAEALYEELNRLEEEGYARLAATDQEMSLIAKSRQAHLTAKLIDFSLTPEEWKEYSETVFLNPGESPVLELRPFERFYEEAHSRDAAMAKNLVASLTGSQSVPSEGGRRPGEGGKRDSSKAMVLVTGGFHAGGMEKLLTQSGIAVITYVPKIEKVDTTQGSAYLGVFTREKTPLEKLFAGEKLYLTQHPNQGIPQAEVATAGLKALLQKNVGLLNTYFKKVSAPGRPIHLKEGDIEDDQITLSVESEAGAVRFTLAEDEKGEVTSMDEAVSPWQGKWYGAALHRYALFVARWVPDILKPVFESLLLVNVHQRSIGNIAWFVTQYQWNLSMGAAHALGLWGGLSDRLMRGFKGGLFRQVGFLLYVTVLVNWETAVLESGLGFLTTGLSFSPILAVVAAGVLFGAAHWKLPARKRAIVGLVGMVLGAFILFPGLIAGLSVSPDLLHGVYNLAALGLGLPLASIVSKDQSLKKEIQQFISNAPHKVRASIEVLFSSERMSYFENPDNLAIFRNRIPHAKSIFKNIRTSYFNLNETFLKDILFLMIVRGSIKGLVWDRASSVRNIYLELGVNPKKLTNLSDPETVKTVFEEAMSGDFIKSDRFSQKLILSFGRTLEDLNAHDKLFEIYSDQIASILIEELNISIIKLTNLKDKKKHPLGRAKALLAALQLFPSDEMGFVLTNRSFEFLDGGARAGDCTAPGRYNFWTAGAWNGAFENIEIEAYYRTESGGNRFFARFVILLGIVGEKPTLWVHAVEFSPNARQYEEGRGKLSRKDFAVNALLRSLKFLKGFGARAGVPQVYVTGISNSFDYRQVTAELIRQVQSETHVEINTENIGFRLPTGLSSVHSISRIVHGEENGQPAISSYLQGWGGSTAFTESTTDVPAVVKVPIGGGEVFAQDAAMASNALVAYFRKELRHIKEGKVNLLGKEGELALVCGLLFENDRTRWESLYDERIQEIESIARELAHIFAPVDESEISKDIEAGLKSYRQADRRKSVLEKLKMYHAFADDWQTIVRAAVASDKSKRSFTDILARNHMGDVSDKTWKNLWSSKPDGSDPDDWVRAFAKKQILAVAGRTLKNIKIRKISSWLDSTINRTIELDGVNGFAMVQVMDRLHPEWKQWWSRYLNENEFLPDVVVAFTRGHAELINYYIQTASRTTEAHHASWTSQIKGYSLQNLEGQFLSDKSVPEESSGTELNDITRVLSIIGWAPWVAVMAVWIGTFALGMPADVRPLLAVGASVAAYVWRKGLVPAGFGGPLLLFGSFATFIAEKIGKTISPSPVQRDGQWAGEALFRLNKTKAKGDPAPLVIELLDGAPTSLGVGRDMDVSRVGATLLERSLKRGTPEYWTALAETLKSNWIDVGDKAALLRFLAGAVAAGPAVSAQRVLFVRAEDLEGKEGREFLKALQEQVEAGVVTRETVRIFSDALKRWEENGLADMVTVVGGTEQGGLWSPTRGDVEMNLKNWVTNTGLIFAKSASVSLGNPEDWNNAYEKALAKVLNAFTALPLDVTDWDELRRATDKILRAA